MDPEAEKRLTKHVLDNAKAESILNQEGDQLPFGYFNPETEGKLIWMCNYDAEGKLTQVYSMDLGTHREPNVGYLETVDQAIVIRDELIRNGWQPLKAPDITFSYTGDDTPLNRKQRRYLKKKIKQMDKKNNPFEKDDY